MRKLVTTLSPLQGGRGQKLNTNLLWISNVVLFRPSKTDKITRDIKKNLITRDQL